MTSLALYRQPELHALGALVEDEADVVQCFGTILQTRKGSIPHRLEFGSDLWRWLDKPMPQAIPGIIAEARRALTRWEPRATIIGVSAEPVLREEHIQYAAHVRIFIDWVWAGVKGAPVSTAEVPV